VRTLVDNDDALHDGILEALEEYNTEQHITVKPSGFDYEVNVYFLPYSCCYYCKA
jgi:capping protein alpha